MNWWDRLLPPAATEGVLLWAKYYGEFDLKPLANWHFPPVVEFVVAGGGLLLAYTRMKKKWRMGWFAISLLLMVTCVVAYGYFCSTPPDDAQRFRYDVLAQITFWGSYFTYGFATATLCRFLTAKG